MKYNIYINQRQLSKTKLDLLDATILDYLYFLCNSVNPKIQKERVDGFTWADYGKILEDNPMLRIKSRGSITARIKKIKEEGFIDTLEKRKNGHKFIYVKLKPRIDSLFTDMNRGQEPIHTDEKPIHSHEKPIHTDEPIKTTTYNTTKDNTTNKDVPYLIKQFEKLDPKNKKYYNNKTQRGACEFLLKEYGLDKLEQVIDFLPKLRADRFCPSISSPTEMVDKWSKLENYLLRKKSEQEGHSSNFL